MIALCYIASFLLMTIVQSMMINGIHISMDGKDKIDKEGNWLPVGDILYPIARKLRRANKRIELLSYGAARKAVGKAAAKSTHRYPYLEYAPGKIDVIKCQKQSPDFSKMIAALNDMMINFGIKYAKASEFMHQPDDEKYEYYVLYVEEYVYDFPSFVRKSIGGGCIKCMASFYGIITFIPFFIVAFGWNWMMIPLVVVDVFVLVYLNFLFYKQ